MMVTVELLISVQITLGLVASALLSLRIRMPFLSHGNLILKGTIPKSAQQELDAFLPAILNTCVKCL